MNNNFDMSKTIAPKSDQTNYDDFLSGPKDITITGVTRTGNATDAQPVSVHYREDNGKPYKPCKSMRRVMVSVWGVDAVEYVGKSMTLFGDPNVIFGGQKVGGIRISHMSHIDQEVSLTLRASKKKVIPYKVKPLKIDIDYSDVDDAKGAAEQGMEVYKKFFASLSAEDKKGIIDSGAHDEFKAIAAEISNNKGQEND